LLNRYCGLALSFNHILLKHS